MIATRRSALAVLLVLAAGCDATLPWASTGRSAGGGGGGGGGAASGTLAVSPASLQVSAPANGAAPATATLTLLLQLNNTSSVYLSASATGDAVAAASWDTGSTSPDPLLLVTFPSPGATARTRTGTVTIDACLDFDCARPLTGSPFLVPVTYVVDSTLVALPSSVAATWTRGDPAPLLAPVTLSESGVIGGTATPTITWGDATGWLAAATASIPGTSALTLTPDGLAAGVHGASIRYTSLTGETSDVTVSLTVLEPVIASTPAALTFAGFIGQPPPAAQAVSLANGGVPVTYAVAVEPSGASAWLQAPATVTLPQDLSLQPTTTALAVGAYTATVTFRSADGTVCGSLPVSYGISDTHLVSLADQTLVATPSSVPSDLAGAAAVDVNAGPVLTWNGTSDAAWLVVDSPTGATGTSLAWHVDPSTLTVMAYGDSKVGTITVATTSPALSRSFAVTLVNHLPAIRWVMPSVQPAGRAVRVRLRGSGFSLVDPTTLEPVAGITGASVTRLSDTALVVDLPAAPAGDRSVSVLNALGVAAPTAILHHVAPVAATYQKVAQSGPKRAMVYDTLRDAVLTVNAGIGGQDTVVRFSGAAGAWAPAVRSIPAVQDLALSPDGSLLVVATSDTVRLLDPATLADVASAAPPFPAGWSAMSESDGLAVGNDGRVLMPGGSAWGGLTTFDLVTRTFGTPTIDPSVGSTLFYGGPWDGASRDGERLLIVQSASLSPAPPMLYADATDGVVRRNQAGLTFFYHSSLGDDGGRVMLDAWKVYDHDFGTVGTVTLPATHALSPGGVLSPDGQRAYVMGYVSGYKTTAGAPARIFVLDTSAVPVSGPDLPVIRSFDLPDHVSCNTVPYDDYGCQFRVHIAVSPDEQRLYVLGQQGLLVVPIPAP
jgi:hypothetical protein